MKISYDDKYNVAYIQFKDKTDKVRTIPLSEQVNVDLSPDGSIYGIELLNAGEQLGISGNREIIIYNITAHQSVRIPIAD